MLEREEGTSDGEPARLLAVPAGDEVVVAGAALDDQEEALATLLALGGAALLAALLLGSAAGYWAAGIALRPVEAMRAGAEAITDTPDRRLPVPPVDDEIGRLGATLNAMLERLEEAAAKERRFVADASHELRTPLTILKSEIDVALATDRPAEELRAALASAGEEADRLTRLAEDLLVLARAGEGALPLAPEPVAVRGLLDDAAARNRRRGEISVAAPAGPDRRGRPRAAAAGADEHARQRAAPRRRAGRAERRGRRRQRADRGARPRPRVPAGLRRPRVRALRPRRTPAAAAAARASAWRSSTRSRAPTAAPRRSPPRTPARA